MKKNILPLLLLFSVVFSFSLNALNSINTATNDFFHSTKKISPPSNSNAQENFVFEELENDSEDIVCDAFLLLPFYNLTCNINETTVLDFYNSTSQKATQPIFIAIRVLRI
ncbi:MAG: hypothetical protein SFY56_16300 [Bacteroidota bacterium]|nr:hypothetical protein [Bacteroidota bacterium]